VRPSQVQQPSVTDDQQDKDSPYQVMDMPAAHHHPMERSLAAHDVIHQQAHAKKCHKEGNGSQKDSPPRPVRDRRANQIAKPCQLQDHQENRGYQQDKQQQDKRSSLRHIALLKH